MAFYFRPFPQVFYDIKKNNIPLFKSDRVKLPTDNMYGK